MPEDKLRVTVGSTKQYTQTHENGMKLIIHFCDNCGCAIYKIHESFPGKAIVLAGTLDGPEELEQAKPELEFYTKHRAAWLSSLNGATQRMEF